MHGTREGWKRDRGKETAREREGESARERRGAAQWPVVSVELHGPVDVAGRAVAGAGLKNTLGIPNAHISTQAVSRVFQQLLIWNTLECDVLQVCMANSGFAPAREWELD